MVFTVELLLRTVLQTILAIFCAICAVLIPFKVSSVSTIIMESAKVMCIQDTSMDCILQAICPTPNIKQLKFKFDWQFHTKHNRHKYESTYNTAVNAVQNTTGRVQWKVQI